MVGQSMSIISPGSMSALLEAVGQISRAELLGHATQVALLAGLLFVAWLLMRYVGATTSEKRLQTVRRLASVAIHSVEHTGLRRQLDPNASDGADTDRLDKLAAATRWMVRELERVGVDLPEDEARQWVKSELQRRVDQIPPTRLIHRLAHAAVIDVAALAEDGQLTPPEGESLEDHLSRLAADRLRARLVESGVNLAREDAELWIRVAWLDRKLEDVSDLVRPLPSGASAEEQLTEVAKEAGAFVRRLEARGLTVHGDDVGWYLRVSRTLTQAARMGLDVSIEQVFAAASDEQPVVSEST